MASRPNFANSFCIGIDLINLPKWAIQTCRQGIPMQFNCLFIVFHQSVVYHLNNQLHFRLKISFENYFVPLSKNTIFFHVGCSFMLILHTDTEAGLSYNPKKWLWVLGLYRSRRFCKSPFFQTTDVLMPPLMLIVCCF